MKEVKHKKKLKFHIKVILLLIIIIIYSFTLGTKGIFIKEYKVETNKLDKTFHGLKILHFSDLHYGTTIKKNDLKKIVLKINKVKPDIIVFTGDLIDESLNLNNADKEFMKKELSKLDSDLGKFYVPGEEDNDQADEILNMSDFINVDEKEEQIYKSNQKPITILGKNYEEYIKNNQADETFKLLLVHNPEKYDAKAKVDMVVAGHTHGDQINVIGIKKLLNNNKYDKNCQVVNGVKLFVNSGIGTSNIPARLFNHPTLNVYRINIKE